MPVVCRGVSSRSSYPSVYFCLFWDVCFGMCTIFHGAILTLDRTLLSLILATRPCECEWWNWLISSVENFAVRVGYYITLLALFVAPITGLSEFSGKHCSTSTACYFLPVCHHSEASSNINCSMNSWFTLKLFTMFIEDEIDFSLMQSSNQFILTSQSMQGHLHSFRKIVIVDICKNVSHIII